MLLSPNPDDFYDAVFFIDPLTHTLDDSLVMALSKDPLNAERYSKYLQVRSSSSSTNVDDETNFDLCLPRSVQSLSEHQNYNDRISSFIRFLLSDHVKTSEVVTPAPAQTSEDIVPSSGNS